MTAPKSRPPQSPSPSPDPSRGRSPSRRRARFTERFLTYLPLFGLYLHYTDADVDALIEERFDLLTAWIDAHEARLRGGE
ncbi:hypothetical protein O1L44_30140 [Streptomyces noursei]|nr:hypothetical protein [Streptomyces noursei]